MTDRDAPLLRAFTRWLADHDVANPAAAARELVHMARGHGWRPIEALQGLASVGGPSGPNDEFRERKAAIEAARAARAPERRS